MSVLLFILAVLPGVVVSYIMYRLDRYEHEPLIPLLLSFLAGALVTIPAIQIEKAAFIWVGRPGFINLAEAALLGFVFIAANEEILKFLLLRFGPYPRSYFNEPLDGIVYAVIIAMGFATAENIAYADRFGMPTLLLRTLTALPAHLVFAIIQGYYAGLAKFSPNGGPQLLWRGLLLSILLHGFYDLLILQQLFEWMFLLATVMLYLGLYYFYQFIQEHQDNSPFRTTPIRPPNDEA
jgi:RsiW-degrading membrane proteinase PrsW (M82 family)